MKKRNVRKEMKYLKKSKAIYRRLGCEKDPTKSLHHNKEVHEGGGNETKNISYFNDFLHKLYHRFRYKKECVKVTFQERVPTYKQAYDQIEKAVYDNYMENER